MPVIVAGGQLVVPDPLPVEPGGTTPVWTEDAGTITATWIDPTGREWPLSNTSDELGWFTANGPAGWGAAPIELVVDPLPRGGEQVRFIRCKPRRMQWPLYIGGADHLEYTARRRAITRAITSTTQRMAPGWLKVARPDGSARMIACYYETGLEGEAREDHLFSKPVVQFYCPDGYWSGLDPVVVEREFGTAATPFGSPFFTIASSRIMSGGAGDPAIVVENPGDVDAWPVWTLDGPLTALTATNHTVSGRFTLTYPLTVGQQARITTNPPSVRGPDGINLARYIDWFNAAGTQLWPLVDGRNEMRFQINGAGPGTRVRMAFTPRYETA